MANDLITHEKVDVVIAGAGASGSTFAAVLAKAGKKVVLIDNGPDWQLTDLISSDILGVPHEAGRPALHPRRQGGRADRLSRRLGRRRCGAALVRQRAAPAAERLQDQERAQPRHDWPIAYEDVAPWYDKVAHDIGISGDAKAETLWRPPAVTIRCRR